jgi:quinol monooxygenase YgiN
MKGLPEKRVEILQTITGVSDQIKLQKGCLSASSYQDINDENIFHLIEVWQTQHDLNEYLTSNLFAVLLGIKNILVESPKVKIMVEDCSYDCDDIENLQIN